MKTKIRLAPVLTLALSSLLTETGFALDYEKDILPLLKEHCFECHSNEEGKTKGNLTLDDIEEMKKYQITPFSLIQPENPDESQFVALMKLPASDSDAMPPKGDRMPQENIKVIEQWIKEGATIDGLTRNAEGKEKGMSGESGENKAKSDDAGAGDAEGASDEPFLKWKNTQGREIEARFGGLSGQNVALLLRDGKSYVYPMSRLDEASQAQARKLAEAAGETEKEPASN
jgi:hypothetical protein